MLNRFATATATATAAALALSGCDQPATQSPTAQTSVPRISCPTGMAPMVKFELYLAGAISDADFKSFTAMEVTPRFPKGITIIDAHNEAQLDTGAIDNEASRILVIVVPNSLTASAYAGAVGVAYAEHFDQDQVMMTQSDVCMTFLEPQTD